MRLWRTYIQLVLGGLAVFALTSLILALAVGGIGSQVFVWALVYWVIACIATGVILLGIACVRRFTGSPAERR